MAVRLKTGQQEETGRRRWWRDGGRHTCYLLFSRRPIGGTLGRMRPRRDRRTPWERRRGLSRINNGWQILRDLVQTLIMDKTQLEKRLRTTEVRWESPRTAFPMRHDTFWRDGEVLFYISTCALSYFCCWRLHVSIFGGITSRGTETPVCFQITGTLNYPQFPGKHRTPTGRHGSPWQEILPQNTSLYI